MLRDSIRLLREYNFIASLARSRIAGAAGGPLAPNMLAVPSHERPWRYWNETPAFPHYGGTKGAPPVPPRSIRGDAEIFAVKRQFEYIAPNLDPKLLGRMEKEGVAFDAATIACKVIETDPYNGRETWTSCV